LTLRTCLYSGLGKGLGDFFYIQSRRQLGTTVRLKMSTMRPDNAQMWKIRLMADDTRGRSLAESSGCLSLRGRVYCDLSVLDRVYHSLLRLDASVQTQPV
jgi:hypothetical protein